MPSSFTSLLRTEAIDKQFPWISQKRYAMQVGKWGNSLAVRLPTAVVDALGLQEGDEIEIEVSDPRRFRVARDLSRDEALAALRALGWTLPTDFRFSREEANQREV
jgi:antitoxin MazE